MKKSLGILATVLAAFLALAVFATAHGGWGMHGIYHGQVEEVIEEGTYQDFLDLREELGMPFMRWVDSEEDFNLAKERHEAMEAFHEKYGMRPGLGL